MADDDDDDDGGANADVTADDDAGDDDNGDNGWVLTWIWLVVVFFIFHASFFHLVDGWFMDICICK